MHARPLIFEDCTYVNVDSFWQEQPMKKKKLTTAGFVQNGKCRVSLDTTIS